MENLEKSFGYTREMMSHKIKTMEVSHFKRPIQKIEEYIRGKAYDTVVGTRFTSLSSWYLWNFIHAFTGDGMGEYDLLPRSTYYGVAANKWAYSLGQCSEHYDGAVLFADSSMHLAQLVCLGLNSEAVGYSTLLRKMLNGKQSKMFPCNPVYSWFILLFIIHFKNTVKLKDGLIEESGIYLTEKIGNNMTCAVSFNLKCIEL